MPTTYLSLNVHIVFSTKHRQDTFDSERISQVHDYLGGALRGLEAKPIRVGGVADHVHLLTGIKGTHAVSELVREVKKASTAWLRAEMGLRHFSWQEGFAAFSVSPERVAGVSKYVANQAEHHRTKSYIDELVELLEFANIEFDQKYLE